MEIEHIVSGTDKFVFRVLPAIALLSFGLRICVLVVVEDIDQVVRRLIARRRKEVPGGESVSE